MLHLIAEELSKTPEEERPNAHEKWGRDDEFFVSRMIKFNKASARAGLDLPYVFASPEVLCCLVIFFKCILIHSI